MAGVVIILFTAFVIRECCRKILRMWKSEAEVEEMDEVEELDEVDEVEEDEIVPFNEMLEDADADVEVIEVEEDINDVQAQVEEGHPPPPALPAVMNNILTGLRQEELDIYLASPEPVTTRDGFRRHREQR